MSDSFNAPLVFAPIFMERIWGGRRLESLYGKRLPPGVRIGESWEIVDRAEAQSVVEAGLWRGRTLHQLWVDHRKEVFGDLPDAPRFPLLMKLLDAQEKLSVQVHPPAPIAARLGGEAKTEFWYIADASPAAELYVGLKKGSTQARVRSAIESGSVEEHMHRVPVRPGDSMFLPSGRVHSIGAGTLIIEIQQNSDTTYRVFDWNRPGADGQPRTLQVEEAMQSIDFDDWEPGLVKAAGESLVEDPLFSVEKWTITSAREVSPRGRFAIVGCLAGEVHCAGAAIKPGEFFLVPASLKERQLTPSTGRAELLRVTIPA